MRGGRALAVVATLVVIVLVVLWARWSAQQSQTTATNDAGAGAIGGLKGPSANEPIVEVGTGVIDGHVRAPDGSQRDGAFVVLQVVDQKGYPRSLATALSAGGGMFRFPALARGRYRVSATARGFQAASSDVVDLVLPGTTQSVELRLVAGGVTLSGRVLDSGGGPINGASVSASAYDGMFETTSDAQGDYALTLASRRYDLVASAEGYAPHTRSVVAETDATVDFLLHPGGLLRGHVVRGSEPIAGAEILLFESAGDDFRAVSKPTMSDDSGAFEVRGLNPGEYRVLARNGALVGVSRAVTMEIAGSADVTLTLENGAVLSGRVRGTDGAPIPGAVVLLKRRTTGDWRAIAGPDGAYRVEGLPRGDFGVTVDAAAYTRSDVALTVGSQNTKRDFELARPGSIEGTVTGPRGAAVEGAEVVASQGGFFSGPRVKTDAAGHFAFSELAADKWQISASSEGRGGMVTTKLAAGEKQSVALRLELGGLISGKISWKDGKPAAGAYVRVALQTDGPDAVVGADGNYELGGLPPGDVFLIATPSKQARSPRGGRRDSKSVKLASGEAKRGVDFVLEKESFAIRGVVVHADGTPAQRIAVLAGRACEYETSPPFGNELTSDSDGRFVVDELKSGKHDICAFPPGLPKVVVSAVEAGSASTRIVLPRGSMLSGVVVDKVGKRMRDCSVHAVSQPDGERMASDDALDARGGFELRGLAAGTYELRARTDDGRVGVIAPVTVADGEDKRGLRLVVERGASLRGRVVDESGAPLRGAAVSTDSAWATTDQSGAFVVMGLIPGAVTLNVVVSPSAHAAVDTRTVTIRDGADTDVGTLRLVTREVGAGIVGLQLEQRDGHIKAAQVLPGLPAAQAGMVDGEEIIAIDGIRGSELTDSSARLLIRGEPNTRVTLVVAAPNGGPQRTLVLVRAKDQERQ